MAYLSDRVLFACTALIFKAFRIDTGGFFLHRLWWYRAVKGAPPDTNASKRVRRQAAAKLLDGPESLFKMPFSPKDLANIPFTKDFGRFTAVVAILVVNLTANLVTFAYTKCHGDNLMLDVFALLVGAVSVMYTAKVELQHSSHGTFHLVYISVLGMAVSVIILLLVPAHVLEFETSDAARSLSQVIQAVGVRGGLVIAGKHSGAPATTIQPHSLALAVSAFAGVMSAVLLAPATRFARIMWQATNVRPWGMAYIGARWDHILVLRLALLLPITLVLWEFKPMVSFWPVLAVSPALLQWLQPARYLAVAVVHLVALQPLSQHFLNSGVLEYHGLRHNGMEHVHKEQEMEDRLARIAVLIGRVSVQLLSLGAMMTSYGVLVLLHGGALPGSNTSMATLQPAMVQSKLAFVPLPMAAHEQVVQGSVPAFALGATGSPVAAARRVATAGVPATELEGLDDSTEELSWPGCLPGLEGDGQACQASTGLWPRESAAGLAPGARGHWAEQGTGPMGAGVSAGSSGQGHAGCEPGASHLLHAPALLFLGRYLGWWACLVWSVYTLGTLAIFRLGLGSS